MPIIKIPKRYLVEQDEESITLDVPAKILALWQHNYTTVTTTVTADRVRDKLEALEITEEDIADTVAWARQDP